MKKCVLQGCTLSHRLYSIVLLKNIIDTLKSKTIRFGIGIQIGNKNTYVMRYTNDRK